jgi:tellurite resistance protein TehA-like permease
MIILGINDATMFEWLRMLAIILFLLFCVCFTFFHGIVYLYKFFKRINNKNK